MTPIPRTAFESSRVAPSLTACLTALLFAGLLPPAHGGAIPQAAASVPLAQVPPQAFSSNKGAATAAAGARRDIDLSFKRKDAREAWSRSGPATAAPQAPLGLRATDSPAAAGSGSPPSKALPLDSSSDVMAAVAALTSAWLLKKAFPAFTDDENAAPARKHPAAIPDRGAGPPSTSTWTWN